MQLSNNIVPKKDWGFNGTGNRAAYALFAYNASGANNNTSIAFYDENFRSVGGMRSTKFNQIPAGFGSNQFSDVIDLAQGAANNNGSDILTFGTNRSTTSAPSSGATSNWFNATNANGEFSNAMLDVFSDGIIESAWSRGDTQDSKHYLNTCIVNSDHTDKSTCYLLTDGKIRAVSRMNGQPKYGKAGTTDFAIPTSSATNIASMKGSASYNKALRQLVILSYRTGTQFDVLTYAGVEFDKYPSPAQALTATGVTVTATTASFSTGMPVTNSENTLKPSVFLCDSGAVLVSYLTVNGASSKFVVDKLTRATTAGQAGTVNDLVNQSVTANIVGYDAATASSIAYGARQISSRDGQAAVSFCAYTYYGTGIVGFILDRKNDSVATLIMGSGTPLTTVSYKILPYKDTGFVLYEENNVSALNPQNGKMTTWERGDTLSTANNALRITSDARYLPYFPYTGGQSNYPALMQVVDFSMLVRDPTTNQLFTPYGDMF